MNITLASTFCLFFLANRLYHCILHPVEAGPVASTLPPLQFTPELPFIYGHKGYGKRADSDTKNKPLLIIRQLQ